MSADVNLEAYKKGIKEFYALGQVHALEVAIFAAERYTGEELIVRLQGILAKAQVAREAISEGVV